MRHRCEQYCAPARCGVKLGCGHDGFLQVLRCVTIAPSVTGCRAALVIPNHTHTTDVGGIRRQFHHLIDIVPTILEAWRTLGTRRMPTHPLDTRHNTSRCSAIAPSTNDGWVAATTPVTLPWELSSAPPPDVITGYKWELYNVKEDPTEYNDLASKMPGKLKEMQDLFYSEAKKYNVLPLDNSTLARWNTPRPSLTAGQTVFTYSGELTGVPASAAPDILNKSYTITAEVEIPKGGAEGMIVTQGGRFGGYGLFLSKGEFGFDRGKVVFLYNLLDLKRTMWEGPELEAGKHTIVFDFKSDGDHEAHVQARHHRDHSDVELCSTCGRRPVGGN
jgi:hypothetical protein